MNIRYNEKGKFFTDVVSKEAIPIVIQTLVNRIDGHLHVRQGERVRDGVNKDDQFVAVTDVTIFSIQGKKIFETNFLLVNKDQIIWMSPIDEDEVD
jgi:hypothetical protein